METAIYHGIPDIRVGEVPDLEPGPGDVKVKIKYRGICACPAEECVRSCVG